METDSLAAEARLAIYVHHVTMTLTQALAATFPVVKRLVGAGFFAYAADRYLRAHPPAGPCLAEYGGSFPAFLDRFEPARILPCLGDVARLEWALASALQAPLAVPLDPQALSSLAPDETPGVVLHLQPSLVLLTSPWPVGGIWRANQPEHDPPPAVDLDGGAVWLEVSRHGDGVAWRDLDPGTHALRARLAAGESLETAAEAALLVDPAFDLAGGLRRLFEEQLVVGLTPAPLT